MERQDAEEYTRSLGQVVGGSWGMIALADRLGVPAALGMSTREWVETRLGGYVKLTIEDRREAVAELAAEGLSQRGIASVLGVDPMTVNRDIRVANSAAVGEDSAQWGREDVADSTQEPPPLLSVVDLETGEIVATAEEYAAQQRLSEAALIDAVDDDGSVEDQRLRVQFFRGVKSLTELVQLKPEAIGAVADDEVKQYARSTFPMLREWMAAVEAAMPAGLRRVI